MSLCVSWFPEWAVIISPNSINCLVFVMKIVCILCEVGTVFLHISVSIRFQMVNEFPEPVKERRSRIPAVLGRSVSCVFKVNLYFCFVQSTAVSGGAPRHTNNWWAQPGCAVGSSARHICATTQLPPWWRTAVHRCSRICSDPATITAGGTTYRDARGTFPAQDASPTHI